MKNVNVSAHLRDGTVALPWAAYRTSAVRRTDRDGRFAIEELPDMPLAIRASVSGKDGTASSPVELKVDESNAQDLSIVLDPTAMKK